MGVSEMIKNDADISKIKPNLERITEISRENCRKLIEIYDLLGEGEKDFKEEIAQDLYTQTMTAECYFHMSHQKSKEGITRVLGSYLKKIGIIEENEIPQLNYEVLKK